MTYKKKLIEVAIPLAKINEESAREKNIRHGHPSTLHLWWARRPLASARAVLFAQLVDDPSAHPDQFPTEEDQHLERKRLFDIIERLVRWEATTDQRVLDEAHAEILKSCDGDLPKILDPFGGGGTIPLEALRLGLPSYSGDLNPVAVLIQRAMLEIPQRFANRPPVHPGAKSTRGIWQDFDGLAADLQAYGEWMRQEAKGRIGVHYPDMALEDGSRATIVAWIWARTVKSPDPSWSGHVPLVRSWVLSKRAGQQTIWVEPVVNHSLKTISYRIRAGGTPGPATTARGNGVCIATGAPIPSAYIKEEGVAGRHGRALLAVVVEGQRGREYVAGDEEQEKASNTPPANWGPEGGMSDHPQYMGTPRYGLDEWATLFVPRQLLALTTYVELLHEVRHRVVSDAGNGPGERLRDGGDGASAYADAVTSYLALGVSRLADMCNSLCGWEASRTQVRHLFTRQSIPMMWDFAENNVFNDAGGDFRTSLNSVIQAVRKLPVRAGARTAQRDARARIAEVGRCVLATDPPYYDNVPYADLADFFYVWLRPALRDVWPDEFATLLTPKLEELVANHIRAGSWDAAQAHFELGMQGVFSCAAENADERFPATVFYAFKATEDDDAGVASTGWETFLSGLLDSGYTVTATWPMRTELANRMRAHGSNALATSVVLACRKRHVSAPMATRGEFVAAMRNEMPPAVRLLQEQNIAPVDMAQSAIGPGIAVFSRYAKVVEADGSAMSVRTALALINEVLAETLSGEEGEFDADTRFALTWFEQFGHNPGPYGDADTLAKAKNTTVGGVVHAGVAASQGGRLRLVERQELPEDWDPMTDNRFTVWETAQHLIRRLERSETEAADLLRRIGGGNGERARQLAYLMYGICDRKKWAEEAGAYNMLVTAWPTIVRLAAAPPAAGDGKLF